MKTWYKYLLSDKDASRFFAKDSSFEDHKKSMEGYGSNKGYGSKEEFFRAYIYNNHPRHMLYHDYLKRHLKNGDNILSIGSGRSANELLLMEEGFNITCSDLEQPCQKVVEKIFHNIKFLKFDITKSSSQEKFDCIISLSVFYLFDETELLNVFTNVANSLKPGGMFIFDPGGAEDNLLTRLIDDLICRLEAHLRVLSHKVLRRENCVVTKKHHGYRTTNNDMISIAGNAGFRMCDIQTNDYASELRRLRFFELLPEKIVSLFGRSAPYVRIFNFKKNG